MENEENSPIIQKCIDYTINQTLSNNIQESKWTSDIANWKNKFKYNIIRFNSKFDLVPAQIHVFNKICDTQNQEGIKKFNQKINKLTFVSYRSRYKPQTNIKNNSTFTTDCGWGCMIRSSQMILCKAISKIIKYKNKNKFNIAELPIPFIMDNNLKLNEANLFGFEDYIIKLKEFKNDISCIDPPFSIHKICILGEIFGRTCGEWFSDFELPEIYSIINKTFNIFPKLKILHFNSVFELHTILKECFKEINDNSNEDNNCFNKNNKNYMFENMGLIFISVRLGIKNIAKEYFPSIKKLFDCKECLGFIGGKMNAASYFFGYYDNFLLYLDPHHNTQSVYDLDVNSLKTYTNKVIYKLRFTSLQTAFTVGYLFRDINEFKDLVSFIKSISEDNFSCFKFEENEVKNEIDSDKINYEDNNKDDF